MCDFGNNFAVVYQGAPSITDAPSNGETMVFYIIVPNLTLASKIDKF